MDKHKKTLLIQLLLWMEEDGLTFVDIAVPSKNLTYAQLFDQIYKEFGYGARVLKSFKRCISWQENG